jgi:endo-1,4-beta-xylanase
LRSLGLRRGIWIGVAVAVEPLRQDPRYAQTVREEFSVLTPEDAMKWDALRPSQESYDFAGADTIVDFAEANGMQVRGHTLVWHDQLPNWLGKGNLTRGELRAILREHILTVVGRYRGRVAAWDVVNEAVDEDEPSSLRDSFWLRGLGQEYLVMAFRWAHEADPQARLFYNDFGGEGLGQKSDAVYQMVKGLLQQGVPIHGVGLQMHVGMHDAPLPEEVAANMARLAELGLEIHITEMDARIQKGTGVPYYDLASQARIYQNLTTVCLNTLACKALVVWGVTDQHSWIPRWTRKPDAPLLFDGSYTPKLAYYGIQRALEAQ